MAKGKYEYWRTPDGLMLLESWARNGLTYDQVAKNIGVSRSTLMLWVKQFSDIHDALNAHARDLSDIEVENALRKRALGYRYVEITRERVLNRETKEFELVVTREVEKEMPPDVTAQIFWLKNRRARDWRDKRETLLAQEEGQQDDGFLDALNATAAEVMVDGGDTPQNTDD